jgi:hypothetical protein
MPSPFATEAMAALRARLADGASSTPMPVPAPPERTCRDHRGGAKRKPDLNTLRVWNGNEGPTLQQLVEAVPPAGGIAALVESMATRKDPAPMEPKPSLPAGPRRPVRRFDDDKPRRHFTEHVRELQLPDGRRILADRRAVAFIVEAKPGEAGGKAAAVIAFRSMVKGVPVTAGYDDLKRWWLGIGPGRSAAAPAAASGTVA